ncbi:GlxA family transcriptional regulator [Comamonas testosteroni]|uniref:GlxA family transcriptional regulator n=1 Tax=Comamonas testosteroni TaxID=285 RepID=UPI002DBE2B1A|nr:helix-turn-helix domain-containing protein [Comamonas testosteroni]MEB5963871.1 helix-turn-helix domain-containing protein [Comamonas testosteroni]
MPRAFVIELPCLEHSATGHAAHLVEMLRSANLVASLRLGRRAPRFGWRWVDGRGQPLPAMPHTAEGALAEGPVQAVFASALHCPDIPSIRDIVATNQTITRRIATAFDQGLAVCTLGSAAWFAAAGGRCQGRRVALPWYFMGGFGLDFPDIELAEGQPFVDDGPWLSASHPEALASMAVALTRHAFGDDLAAALAALLLPDPQRERATLAALQDRRIPATRTSVLAHAIAWLEARVEQPYDLRALADAVSASPRTLLRHFQQELGYSPLDHLHRLRCARARVLLEITLESVPSVALACGYEDASAFRRVFVRHVGMTPAAYRERHALRAPRRRWRVAASEV